LSSQSREPFEISLGNQRENEYRKFASHEEMVVMAIRCDGSLTEPWVQVGMRPIPTAKKTRNARLSGWVPQLRTEIQKTNFPREL